MTVFSNNLLFGISRCTPSTRRIRVERVLMASTRPLALSTSRKSPILIGRSHISIHPLIKLFIMFCAPKPTPIAIAPDRNAKAVMGTSKKSSVVMASMTIASTYRIRFTKCTKSACTPFAIRRLDIVPTALRVIQMPKKTSIGIRIIWPSVTVCPATVNKLILK